VPCCNARSTAPYGLPNRLRRTTRKRFEALLNVLRRFGLAKDIAEAYVVIAAKEAGRILTAEITVDAAIIDKESARDVLRESVLEFSHRIVWVN
jgi:hypothetical protein